MAKIFNASLCKGTLGFLYQKVVLLDNLKHLPEAMHMICQCTVVNQNVIQKDQDTLP